MYYGWLLRASAGCIKTAALYCEKGAITQIEYKGVVRTSKHVRLPWQFSPASAKPWQAAATVNPGRSDTDVREQ